MQRINIITNQSQDQINELFNNYIKGGNNNFSQIPKIQEILFFYTEYMKRKFYLDCTVEKREDVYIEYKNKYRPVKFTPIGRSSAVYIIKKEFIPIDKDSLLFGIKNRFINDEIKNFKNNLYIFLKNEYKCLLQLIKDLIMDPKEFDIQLHYPEDVVLECFLKRDFNDKSCDLILYCLGDSSSQSIVEYPIRNILNIIRDKFYHVIENDLVFIFKYIVDKYNLYLSDLFCPVDSESLIMNKCNLPAPSRIFSLKNLKEYIIDVSLAQYKKGDELSISIAFDNKKQEYIIKNLNIYEIFSALYERESLLLNSLNTNNHIEANTLLRINYDLHKADSIIERCVGLLLWDKLCWKRINAFFQNIVNDSQDGTLSRSVNNEALAEIKDSVLSIVRRLPENIWNKSADDKSQRKAGERCLNGTICCIESGDVLALKGNDAVKYSKMKETKLEDIMLSIPYREHRISDDNKETIKDETLSEDEFLEILKTGYTP